MDRWPGEDERTAIQLLPGDWILAPAGGLCVWCLLNTWAVPGTMGELFVYPLSAEEFSWAQARKAFMKVRVSGNTRYGGHCRRSERLCHRRTHVECRGLGILQPSAQLPQRLIDPATSGMECRGTGSQLFDESQSLIAGLIKAQLPAGRE